MEWLVGIPLAIMFALCALMMLRMVVRGLFGGSGHAKPDPGRDIGFFAESYNDSRTDGDHKRFASTGAAHSDTGGRRAGFASERSGAGC